MRKNRPLSSSVERAGEVAEGEIMTTPFGIATFCSMAVVTPEQSPPTMAFTRSEVISRSAAAVAAAASTQVVSPRTGITAAPSSSALLSLTSAMASSALAAMSGVSDSIGPVKPIITPILISAASAEVIANRAAKAMRILRIASSLEKPGGANIHAPARTGRPKVPLKSRLSTPGRQLIRCAETGHPHGRRCNGGRRSIPIDAMKRPAGGRAAGRAP